MKTYTKLKENIRDFNELKIKVDYSLGGINYISGDRIARGYYAYITPVKRTDGIESCILLGDMHESGLKVCIETTGRKSSKRLEQLSELLEPMAQKITDMFEAKDYQGINDLIKND